MLKMSKGLSSAVVLFILAMTGDSASALPGLTQSFSLDSQVRPVAMCGWDCRRGSTYIPGPPSVCAREGMYYCGSSQPRYAPPPRDVIIVPGGGYRRDYDREPAYGGGLRPGQRDGIDSRQVGRPGQRDGIDSRQIDNRPCRQRLVNSRGEGYWGPGRNCDEGR